MKQTLFCLLALMLLAPPLFAEGEGGSGAMEDYFDSITDETEDEAMPFVDAAWAAGGAAAMAPENIYFSFSPGECGEDSVWNARDPGAIIGTWLVPALVAALIVVFGITLVYMAGQLLNMPQLSSISKEEGFQTVLTIVRVVFLIGTLWAGNYWYGIMAPADDPLYRGAGGEASMITAAGAFARLMVSEMVSNYSMLLIYNMVLHTIYSSTMWIGITWRAMYSFNMGPILKPLLDIVGMALQYLGVGIGEWMMHIVTLCMIKRWTWTLFIPVAILLRAVPHTRGAGEALFAIIFAMATIYPFMFLFDYEVHKLLSTNLIDGEGALRSFIGGTGIMGVAASVLVVMLLMGGVFIPFFLGGALNIAFELVRSAVYYVVMMSFFMPFINLFVTLTAARETAKVFNVDVNYMAFLKII